jgi:hypothetical protein
MQVLCRAPAGQSLEKQQSLWGNGLARALKNALGWPQNAYGAVG